MSRQPPNSAAIALGRDFSGTRTLTIDGPCTIIVEQFTAYIGAPDALLRNALVVVDFDTGVTVWEAHVDVGMGGFPVYVTTNGRWIWSVQPEGPSQPFYVDATTGSWDFAAFGFILDGVNPQTPTFFG